MTVSFYTDVYPRLMDALRDGVIDTDEAGELVALARRVPEDHRLPTESHIRAARNTAATGEARTILSRFLDGTHSRPGPASRRTTSVDVANLGRTEARLRELGYVPEVAARIAMHHPELAIRILSTPIDHSGTRSVRATEPHPLMNFGPVDGRPVTVYRGVCIDPDRYDPAFTDTRLAGLRFFSTEVTEPHKYAAGMALRAREKSLARGETRGTLIEAQIPGFLLYYQGHPVVRAADVPDLSAFITRISAVDLTKPYFPALSGPDVMAWSKWKP